MNKWRVAWYDDEGYERDSRDFRHESEALRKRERWKKERPESTVTLFEYRFDAEPTADGTPRGHFVFVNER